MPFTGLESSFPSGIAFAVDGRDVIIGLTSDEQWERSRIFALSTQIGKYQRYKVALASSVAG